MCDPFTLWSHQWLDDDNASVSYRARDVDDEHRCLVLSIT